MKKKSGWWIWTLLAVVFMVLAGLTWKASSPEFVASAKNTRITHERFVSALVLDASIFASLAPYTKTVLFANGDGLGIQSVDVTFHGYEVYPDGMKCAKYYYPSDNVKQAPMRKACLAPEKATETKPSRFGEALRFILQWTTWREIGTLHSNQLYSP